MAVAQGCSEQGLRGQVGPRTKVFAFDPRDHADDYQRQGYVHIRQGLTPEFLDAVEAYASSLAEHKLDDFAIRGKKEQALFEFPPDVDVQELYDGVSQLCGLNRTTMTLSERHFQIYDAEADPEPAAHKDRFPSQVSVGLSVRIPDDSRLVLYPYAHRELNPFNTSAGLVRNLRPEERPQVALAGAEEVVLDDRRGDVVAFPGSTTWHLRRNAARAVNLYLKFNDFGCDPLGEDPYTHEVSEASRDAIASTRSTVGALVPRIGRRFDAISRTYTRAGWGEFLQAKLFAQEPFGITAAQFAVIQLVDGRRTIDDLVEQVADDGNTAVVREQVVELVRQGALDVT